MKYLILLLFLILFISQITFSQNNLILEISELRNSNGKILLEFNDENEKVLEGYSETISNNKCVISIKDLKSGKYAFKFFHDENNDEKLNTNFMGIPKEGYGFSNSAKGSFGPPSFEKMLFELTKSDTLHCTPNYILKQK